MTDNYTPTPWLIEPINGGETYQITSSEDNNFTVIAETPLNGNGKENAEYIVRSCNAFPDLVVWIEMSPHHEDCSLALSIKETVCDCGRDAALAKSKAVQS